MAAAEDASPGVPQLQRPSAVNFLEEEEEEVDARVVNVKDVIDDVYEYHGISDLGWFLIYTALAVSQSGSTHRGRV